MEDQGYHNEPRNDKEKKIYIVKPELETTCIKRPHTLRDHCSYKATLLNSTLLNLYLKISCCKRPL